MKIYGYEYKDYIEIREKIQLAMGIIQNYIYIIKCDSLYFIGKQDVSMLEIEKYIFVGKVLGQDVYVEPILFKAKDYE